LPCIKILLLNTNVKHSLASSAYNTRRNECEQAVQWIKEAGAPLQSLRDADETMLQEYVLPKNKVVYQRSLFVVQEIARLQAACNDLQNGDIAALGKKMYATHDGLSKLYEVSCAELDFLVDFVRDKEYILGARMMGGGFGGCTINLIKEDKVEELIEIIKPAYETKTGLELSYDVAVVENGTAVV
jgi:galactokinase